MKIIATNIGKPRTVVWNKEEVTTGIYKYPVEGPLFLGSNDVKDDAVIDRKYHGGPDKACYLFSADTYPYWQSKYPLLEWSYGMFGENLTIEGLDESNLRIGDQFEVGDAIVQISEPRQPCFKLNLRFNSNQMLKQFVAYNRCGAYVRVLKTGNVEIDDTFKLIQSNDSSLTIQQVYELIFHKSPDKGTIERALEDPHLAQSTKDTLYKRL